VNNRVLIGAEGALVGEAVGGITMTGGAGKVGLAAGSGEAVGSGEAAVGWALLSVTSGWLFCAGASARAGRLLQAVNKRRAILRSDDRRIRMLV
jgi:hypothetical protein